ncbi:MAG: hemolysin III family protein [Bacteroidia bacterium]
MLGFYQPISSWTHLLGAILTLATGAMLIRKGWGNKIRIASLLIFMLSIVFLFSMSGIYHALEPGLGRQVFRRLDYAGIFIMIAGTATPIHVILFRGWWRTGMLIFIWTVGILGLLLTVILIDQLPEWLVLSVFLAMGWSIMISVVRAWTIYGFKAVALTFLGGLFYTIGALIDFMRLPDLVNGLVGPHEIFHVFVLLGAASHWLLIYQWADQPTHSKLIFMVKENSENEIIAKAVGESLCIIATSRENLRTQVRIALNENFHPRLIPAKIRFRYYRDVVIKSAVKLKTSDL